MRHLSFNVAGCKHHAGQGLQVLECLPNESFSTASPRVTLEPEPSNQYDPHAVKVFVLGRPGAVHVGYVPRDKSEQVAQLIAQGLVDSVELESYGRLKKDPSVPRFRVRVSHYPLVPGKRDSKAMAEGFSIRMGDARTEVELLRVGESIAACKRIRNEDRALLRRLYAERLAVVRKVKAA
jgi:hypothetical protein